MQHKVALEPSSLQPPTGVPTPANAPPGASTRLQLLQWGDLRAEVAPGIGGSLASLFSVHPATGEHRHWLRPASRQGLATADPLLMASFPLVPWANRIRNGRFLFEGRTIQLPPHPTLGRHAIHGLGWATAWDIAARSQEHIRLRMAYDGSGAWPFAFSAMQTYTLDDQGLRIDMDITNLGSERMPADMGHHPYLPHDKGGAGTRVRTQVTGMWESDAELLPTRVAINHPTVQALQHGMLLRDFNLDNNFTGFGRQAEVHWPNGDRLHMESTAPMDYFVLYCPQDQAIFCMEPVSNCTDWFNLRHSAPATAARDTGGNVLEPGQSLHGSLRLQPIPGGLSGGTGVHCDP